MELVQGQAGIGKFANEIQHGVLGTTVPPHVAHGQSYSDLQRCRRLWLRVLEQCAAEAVGEPRAVEDIDGERAKGRAQRQAFEYLRAVSPDLLELGKLMGLTRTQTERIVTVHPNDLLRNLREFGRLMREV